MAEHNDVSLHRKRPGDPIERLLSPFQRFFRTEASSGMVLLACAAIALIWANSVWGQGYYDFWHTYLKASFGGYELKMSLAHFVNDGLMVIFFFVVGLEIKREIIAGELASPRKAALPIVAAVGGLALPAVVYLVFNATGEGADGWAIPAATDIAFAVGVMALLGKRAPVSLKVFLTALAIVDDIGAVIIIALFYSEGLSLTLLLIANGIIVLSIIANILGIRRAMVYAMFGIVLWLLLLQSGVHATVGGVILAMTIPARTRITGDELMTNLQDTLDMLRGRPHATDDAVHSHEAHAALPRVEIASQLAQTPLHRFERALVPWTAFVIMPVFALANAGVTISGDIGEALVHPVTLGVALGLMLGKSVGITLFAWLAVRLGLAQLPQGIGWRHVYGTAWIGGIGFTMSLFIANLAFIGEDQLLEQAKIGILGGSFIAGLTGFLLLRFMLPKLGAPPPTHETEPSGPKH